MQDVKITAQSIPDVNLHNVQNFDARHPCETRFSFVRTEERWNRAGFLPLLFTSPFQHIRSITRELGKPKLRPVHTGCVTRSVTAERCRRCVTTTTQRSHTSHFEYIVNEDAAYMTLPAGRFIRSFAWHVD